MKKILAALVATIALSGCVLPLLAVATMGLWIGSDPRPAAMINSDYDLDKQLETKIQDIYKDRAHVNVHVFNGLVLLTGEVPDDAARLGVTYFAENMPQKPRAVYNETVVAPPSSIANRAKDSSLAAEVKSAVLAETRNANAIHLMVIAERQSIYLMGVASPAIAQSAATASSKVDGVVQVVQLVEPVLVMDKK